MPRAPKLPPSKQMFSDCFDANGECKSPKALVQRRQEFIDAMSKSTYDGLTGRTYMEGESDDGTPLVKSRATVAAGLRKSSGKRRIRQVGERLKLQRVTERVRSACKGMDLVWGRHVVIRVHEHGHIGEYLPETIPRQS